MALLVGYGPGHVDARVRAVVSDAPDPMTGGVQASNVPLLLIQGTADSVVPYSSSGVVFDQIQSPVDYVSLLGADHLPPIAGGTPWTPVLDNAVADFLDAIVADRGAGPAALSTRIGRVPIGSSGIQGLTRKRSNGASRPLESARKTDAEIGNVAHCQGHGGAVPLCMDTGEVMSDTSLGPGWWQASDGKWYPAEQHPEFSAGERQSGAGCDSVHHAGSLQRICSPIGGISTANTGWPSDGVRDGSSEPEDERLGHRIPRARDRMGRRYRRRARRRLRLRRPEEDSGLQRPTDRRRPGIGGHHPGVHRGSWCRGLLDQPHRPGRRRPFDRVLRIGVLIRQRQLFGRRQ